MGYTKLFSSIVASTIWREDDKTRIVWITMLAMKNERHMVEASLPGLADMARVTVEECEMAIKKLESKDGYSRNQDHGGRRIERTQGGWKILNGEYYRQQMSADDRREYQKNYHREYRKLIKTRTKLSGEMGSIAGSQDSVDDALTSATQDT
jgi:hypothetical protein